MMSLPIAGLIVAALLAAAGQMLLKRSALSGIPLRRKYRDGNFVLGIICFVATQPLTIWSLRTVDFSLYYAMTSLNYVFVILFSQALLKEPIGHRKALGCALIVGGLLLFGV